MGREMPGYSASLKEKNLAFFNMGLSEKDGVMRTEVIHLSEERKSIFDLQACQSGVESFKLKMPEELPPST